MIKLQKKLSLSYKDQPLYKTHNIKDLLKYGVDFDLKMPSI